MIKYKFIHPPILIGGKALEHYKLRKAGDDIDYVIHKQDYANILKIYKQNHNMPDQTPAITLQPRTQGNPSTDLFLSLYGYEYDHLAVGAVRKGKILVASKEVLVLLKSLTGFDKKHKINRCTRDKSLRDLSLLVGSLVKK